MDKKRYLEACLEYDLALENDPGNPKILLNKAAALNACEKTQEAIVVLRTIIELYPNHKVATQRLINLGVDLIGEPITSSSDTNASVFHFIQRGNRYIHKKKYSLALKEYELGLSIEPENFSLLYSKTVVYEKMNDLTNAFEVLKELKRLYPTKGFVISKFNQLKEKLKCIQNEGIKREYEERKKVEELAIAQVRPILQNKINSKVTDKMIKYLIKGNKLMNKRKYIEAIKMYDRALGIDPRNITVLLNKASAYDNMNKLRAAFDILQQIIEFDPFNRIANQRFSELNHRLFDQGKSILNSHLLNSLVIKYRRISIDEICKRMNSKPKEVIKVACDLKLKGIIDYDESHVFIRTRKSTQSENTCKICLSDRYTTENPMTLCYQCNHPFHLNELRDWIIMKGTCPVCKKSLKWETIFDLQS